MLSRQDIISVGVYRVWTASTKRDQSDTVSSMVTKNSYY